MSDLKLVNADILREELSKRTKKYSVGFCKKLYQYFEGIEAENRDQAIKIAEGKLRDNGWDDYNNDPYVCDCNERKENK